MKKDGRISKYKMDQREKTDRKNNPGSIPVGFVVDNVALGQVFLPQYFGLPLSISFHRCPITWKMKKTDHLSSSSQSYKISLKSAVHP